MRKFKLFVGVLLVAMSLFAIFASSVLAATYPPIAVCNTAQSSWNRTYDWSIDKTVMPEQWDLLKGDSGISQFTVTVTKNVSEERASIDGIAHVANNMSVATQNLRVVVELSNAAAPGEVIVIPVATDSKPILGSLEFAAYGYHIDIPSDKIFTGSPYTVTEIVTVDNLPGQSFTCSRIVSLPEAPTITNGLVAVDDGDKSWVFSESGSESYETTYTCADAGTNINTATIRGTEKSASAIVRVNCYDLVVTKTASTYLDRTYTWTIEKLADKTAVSLLLGESSLVNYGVTVSADYADSGFAVSGTINIHNPTPVDAVITNISDIISPDITADIDLSGVSFPYVLAAGQTLICNYNASLQDAETRTNTATATLQNHSFNYSEGPPIKTGTTVFSGSVPVGFGNATVNEIDKNINVSDTIKGTLGAVSYNEQPRTFTYSIFVGPYYLCGIYDVINTASFVTARGINGSDSWKVEVNVDSGCTTNSPRTIGYWKTHAGFGVQQDEVTKYLPIRLGTSPGLNQTNKSINVSTAGDAVEILKKNGSSNGIIKLYAQLLAAKLNLKSGAYRTTEIVSLINCTVDPFLAQYDDADWVELSKTDRQQILCWADLLDRYNNGVEQKGSK